MLRSKDFYLMEVNNIKGEKVGLIKDVLIDFKKFIIEGFVVSSSRICKKNIQFFLENLVSFEEKMVIKELSEGSSLKFNEIKNMEVIDLRGDIIGVLEEILFEELSYKIKGIIVSKGLIKNLIQGKEVLLVQDLIIGEENIMFFGENNKIKFLSMPHKFFVKGLYGRHKL